MIDIRIPTLIYQKAIKNLAALATSRPIVVKSKSSNKVEPSIASQHIATTSSCEKKYIYVYNAIIRHNTTYHTSKIVLIGSMRLAGLIILCNDSKVMLAKRIICRMVYWV